MASDRRAGTGSITVVVLLVLALSAPTALLLAIWSRDSEVDDPATRTQYALSASTSSATIGATARPVWSEPAVVRAPDWQGLVTEVLVQQGASVQSGTPVVRVDGVEVRYVALAQPLHHAVCVGDETLVTEVRTVLGLAGMRTGTTRRFSTVDLAAVRRYAAIIGVRAPESVSCFDPGWVLVGSEPTSILATVDLAVGALVPGQGEPVLTAAPTLTGITLASGSGPVLDQFLTPEGAVVFASTELVVAGQPLGIGLTDLGPDGLRLLGEALTAAPPSGASGSAASTPGDIRTVAVVLTLQKNQVTVPATAVVAPVSDQACVLAEGDPLPVTVIASTVSGLVVDLGAHAPPTTVDTSPGAASCG